ncbi:MAG: agmatinase [Polyangiales bacterium]
MTQEAAHAYIRHGQIPFFRLASATTYDHADAVLLGVPWDGGTTHAPGARFAPWEVRKASARVQSFHPQHKVDVFRALTAVDGGNVAVPPFHPQLAREAIEAEIAAIVSADAIPFTVGGDHSIAYPILRAVAKKHGELAVVHVDAHLDTSGPEVWGDPFHHGTPLRHAIGEGLVARGALHQVAIRAPWGSPEEGAIAADHGARLWDVDTIDDLGIAEVAARIREAVGDRPTYVTFDVDGVDPAYAPGTGTPVPGGISAREAIRLIRGLAGVQLVGMDVVEVCPALDVGDATSTLAAHLLYEGLALAALHGM